MTHAYYDLSQQTVHVNYKLICGIVVPRPIALVTSIDEAGRVNAAPFSFFNAFSDDPVQIALGLQHNPDRTPKDTTRNLANATYFCVNMVDEGLAAVMGQTATDFPPDVSEIDALSVKTNPGVKTPVPWIATAPFALECKKVVSLAFSSSREMLIGEVLAIHARDGLTDPKTHYTDTSKYRPIGRLAGTSYCRQGQVFDLPRLTYAEWKARKRTTPVQ